MWTVEHSTYDRHHSKTHFFGLGNFKMDIFVKFDIDFFFTHYIIFPILCIFGKEPEEQASE